MLAPALLLGDLSDPSDPSNNRRRAEIVDGYYEKIGKEIDSNYKRISKLLESNRKCVEGTYKIIETERSRTCHAVYLSIQDLKEQGESKNLELINQLAKQCPEWENFNDIEDCK